MTCIENFGEWRLFARLLICKAGHSKWVDYTAELWITELKVKLLDQVVGHCLLIWIDQLRSFDDGLKISWA